MKEKQTQRTTGGLLVRFGMTALLLLLPAVQGSAQVATGQAASQTESSKDNTQKPKKEIRGKILDEQGEPLIGASVVVRGTTDRGLADLDGNYRLTTSETAPVLVFTYMGYRTKEVAAAGQEVVDVRLEEDTEQLEEVVVTALGIKREKKMLGYAVQDLKSEQLNLTGDPSVTSALSGKIAGVEMNTASTGLGGSTKITIRGNSSLTDNNQPLWIVDGVPFSDNQTSDVTAYGGYDRGGTNFDLNPEDIESISVLKGPNAAALYGARAGNGVILVTTKKGARKEGIGINYSGSFTWSQPAQTIKLQDKYGQGSTAQRKDNVPVSKASDSFGSPLDGHDYVTWNGLTIPYKAYGNKLTDYFKTGFSQFHSVALGKQTDLSHFRLSLGYNDNRGMFKDEKLDKLTIDLNAGHQMNKWLNVDGKVSLSRTKANNRPQTGLGGEVGQLLLIPANVRLCDLAQYSTDLRPHQNWFGPDMNYSNPYYIRHQMKNSDERLRAFGYFSANADIMPWLKFQAKYAFDYYRTRIQETNLSGAISAETSGENTWQSQVTEDGMYRGETNHFEHNISAMFLGDYTLNDNWRFGYTLGGNIMYQKYELLGASARNMLQKDLWLFNTGEKLNSATDTGSDRAMYSIFASAQVAFREYLSLDLTARNDWSSTLPASNRSFFYPSASLSYIFSDFMNSIDRPLPSWMTFSKLRLSWAQVGKDPDPYNLYNTLQYSFSNGVRQSTVQTIKMNDNLKPEIKSSFEVGLDMKFLQNRLGFDFTFYYNTTRNQAMLVSASSPWSQQWVNAGKISNKGIIRSAMLDAKIGGDIVSVSEGIATKAGTSERTLYRGEYMTVNGTDNYYMTVPGVKANGSPNDILVSAENYYNRIGLFSNSQGYAEEFVHDASYIKLKELSLGYDFPKRMLQKTPLTSLRLSFVARNLCFLMKNAPGNPEGGYDTTMFSQALDFLAVPYARTYGLTLNLGL